MRIESIVCPDYIEEKLQAKHGVTCNEARQVLLTQPRIRFAEKGHTEGNDVYAAFGRTFAGRYLSVFFIYKPENQTAIIISARDMSKKERKAYGRK
ncbi:BrnT family toxin [Microcoleus sp. FACHB-1515]|uniref:BrnT family toxin n=1 Tax=Cyanophyceae TaxID=3028117 RepID=UPI001688FFA4|nr:BrnT family toxin [Microcoleus sp. FACHB-1515]MBD2089512.1 BrnT family toxin [Microcoleus sp. FACHB-1515]